MIVNKKGDLLKATDCQAIMHQTNCFGVMGGGIARQIKDKWYKEVFAPYKEHCGKYTDKKVMLGTLFICETNEEYIKYVINAFGEYYFGRELDTDYDALKKCLLKAKEWCNTNNVTTLGIPKLMGCGIAGGDWDGVVYPMIQEVFGDNCTDITLYIYEFNPFA